MPGRPTDLPHASACYHTGCPPRCRLGYFTSNSPCCLQTCRSNLTQDRWSAAVSNCGAHYLQSHTQTAASCTQIDPKKSIYCTAEVVTAGLDGSVLLCMSIEAQSCHPQRLLPHELMLPTLHALTHRHYDQVRKLPQQTPEATNMISQAVSCRSINAVLLTLRLCVMSPPPHNAGQPQR